jgi:tetratricopeptide (TPR) repeat protein
LADWLIAATLVILTMAVFGQVGTHEFLNYDDGQFVYENGHVSQGLTPSSITWALTSAENGWYPLTWLTHELDVTLWGLDPGAHLRMNAAIHALTACLLFFALKLLAGRGAATFAAALFAVHPMHVESVAWISERKDTLSTFFIVLALLLYARAAERRLGVALAMAASLMSKQMYVTFPFVLLLLDYWPLGRLRTAAELKARVAEKLPLVALSIAASAIAVVGQRNLMAMQTTVGLSMASRLANAAVAYCRYLGKLFYPVGLAMPYPLAPISSTQMAAAALLLAAITAAVIVLRKRAPYFFVGWFWFLGTLVPVIGIIALGSQSMADRYSYFSYIGLFLAIAAAAQALPVPRKALATAGTAIVLVCAGIAYHQVDYWRDSETLFAHAIAVTPPNAVAEYSLGQALELTKPEASIAHLRRSIKLTKENSSLPIWYAQAHVGLGTALLMKARQENAAPARVALVRNALQQLDIALKINPKTPHAQNNIAFGKAMLAQAAAGAPIRADCDAAIERGAALLNRGDVTGAITAFRQALDLQSRSATAHAYLALALLRAQRGREAANELRAAKAIDGKLANDFITKALRMPPGPDNIDMVISRLSLGG